MTGGVPHLKKKVELAWNDFRAKMRTMASSADVRPKKSEDIFKYFPGPPMRLEIEPVSFRLKEKPQSNTADLYVTVAGFIDFDDTAINPLKAIKFATQVGYFLEKRDGSLKHIYGVHYDYDDHLIAHPVFHSQMASMNQFRDNINASYNRNFLHAEDFITPILPNVRIPTAQMDAFSVFLQLCADHLINATSVPIQKAAYKQTIELCDFFEGACEGIPRLTAALERQTLRSSHWYAR